MNDEIFISAAEWVHQQQDDHSAEPIGADEIASTLARLHAASQKAQVPVVITDLFPGSALETLLIPASRALDESDAVMVESLSDSSISLQALAAIGKALKSEFARSATEVARYDLPDGSRAVAYLPRVRNSVLQASGVVLLGPNTD